MLSRHGTTPESLFEKEGFFFVAWELALLTVIEDGKKERGSSVL